MKKEIGGYFELEKTHSSFHSDIHSKAIGVNLGRNALAYLIKSLSINTLYIPNYLCDSIEDVCVKNEVKTIKYSIDENFFPILSPSKKDKNAYVYVTNYFGQIQNKQLRELKRKYKNIIVDNVHAYFQPPLEKTNTIYSCRKFFGVPDGAYLYQSKKETISLEKDDSSNRFAHLIGRSKDGATLHYNEFKNLEESYYSLQLKEMSDQTRITLKSINYRLVKSRRTRNYNFLNKELKKYNTLHLIKISGPFCYPLLMKNGSEIKKLLIKEKIYVPTLWPNIAPSNEFEKNILENLIVVPCDQRYKKTDMKRIIKIIERSVS